MKKLFLFYAFLCCLKYSYGQAGTLDPSFAGKGWTTIAFVKGNFYNEVGRQVLPQTNGTYLLILEVNGNTLLARYFTNGALDNSYGKNGYSESVKMLQAKAALQSDDKTVVAGNIYNFNTDNYDFALARYNPDGYLDNSFDGDGKLTTDFFGYSDYAYALYIDKNRLYIVGTTLEGLTIRGVLAVYMLDCLLNTFYKDHDGDGYGNASVSQRACTQPSRYVTNNKDCNDADANVKPVGIEICGNGIDDNCNG